MASHKIKLEPTAAFVMELALKLFHENELTKRFIEQLDLSSAQDLIRDAEKVGNLDLTKELMCNRKFTVRHCLFDEIENSDTPVQIVILAAGKSPLSLEVLQRSAAKIHKIFEVDISSFSEKEKIYAMLSPISVEKIAFVQKDIFVDDLLNILTEFGFNPEIKTILILEGITHYMSMEKCRMILSRFASRVQRNSVIFEYGPPFETLAAWVLPKAKDAYKIIEDRYFIQGMVKYTPEWLEKTLGEFSGKLRKNYPMNEMEKMRTGKNSFFKERNSGWVEVAVGVF